MHQPLAAGGEYVLSLTGEQAPQAGGKRGACVMEQDNDIPEMGNLLLGKLKEGELEGEERELELPLPPKVVVEYIGTPGEYGLRYEPEPLTRS